MITRGFDRLRRRTPDAVPRPSVPRPRDPEGRQLLFTAAEQAPVGGSVTVTCSGCGARTVLSPVAFARHAVPSLHLPLVRRGPWSWLRCPACRRWSWVSVMIRLP